MFRFLTSGESHGEQLTAIVDGVPAGLPLHVDDVQGNLARRRAGHGRGGRMQIESDAVRIVSGVRHGFTLGSPITLVIVNRDWANWQEVMAVEPIDQPSAPVTRLRPGHADLVGVLKYGHEDVRNVLERASARETAARVAVGSVAARLLDEFGVTIHSHTVAIGTVEASPLHPTDEAIRRIDWGNVELSPVRCLDESAAARMVALIDKIKDAGDTLGGVFEVLATGVVPGLGSYVQWDRKLQARLAMALMSINAVKGVEVGAGFALAHVPGSQAHDVIRYEGVTEGHLSPWGHISNNAGGFEGGVTNGEPVVVRAAVKPIPTLGTPLPSVDLATKATVKAHYERSDVCVVPAAGVVGEAMLAIVLAESYVEKFGGDSLDEMKTNWEHYVRYLQSR